LRAEEELWEKIEDWFDKYEWRHCYASFDSDGKLVRVQSGERNWCEGAHLYMSGHYDWNGRTELTWRYDKKNRKGILSFPNGRQAIRWAGYLAVILFKTDLRYSFKRKTYWHVWNGSIPELLFQRERASRSRKRFFSHSPFVSADQAETIKLPENFLLKAQIYFKHLNSHIGRIKDEG